MLRVEMVDVRTADGVRLDGTFLEPLPGVAFAPAEIDAVLMMHGVANTFYDTFFVAYADELVRGGIAVLRANNRGHDIVSRGGDRLPYVGAAYERLDDCAHDWDAWLSLLAVRGYSRVLLWGHSLGAVKSAYYLARHDDARVRACVLASPPRFSYDAWMASPRAGEFSEHLARASALVEAGEPDALMHVTMPVPFIAGARAYLEKYGRGDAFDVFANVPRIACPVLAFTGEEELGDVSFRDHPERFAAAARMHGKLEHAVVPGGDHYYRGVQSFVLERIMTWIDCGIAPVDG